MIGIDSPGMSIDSASPEHAEWSGLVLELVLTDQALHAVLTGHAGLASWQAADGPVPTPGVVIGLRKRHR